MSSLSSHLHSKAASFYRPAASGFGLIELMVSISIMLLVSTLILVRHESFNAAVLLRSQAYEVALTLREVQLSAVSAESNGFNNFRSVEGVHFDTDNDTAYKLFRDADGDSFFDESEEYGKPGSIDSKFEIRGLSAVGDTVDGNAVSVVFERPNFDAKFYDRGGRINASALMVQISKRNATGNTNADLRTVEITATGQITVQ